MSTTRLTAVGGLARGVIAGAVGTLAMDLVWYVRYRRGGGTESFTGWEFSASTDRYEDAPAPAKVGQQLVGAVSDAELPGETAGTMNNLVHWATGSGYGATHGLVSAAVGRTAVAHGLITGPAAFAASYTVLPLMGLYEPLWKYDATTIYKDLSAHLAFGLATAAAFRMLTGASATDGQHRP